MTKYLLLINLAICLIIGSESVRVNHPAYDTIDLNEHSVKIVNYAVKKGNKIVLKTVGVKNPDLMGDPGWIAQGIWTKSYYNSTGYASKLDLLFSLNRIFVTEVMFIF